MNASEMKQIQIRSRVFVTDLAAALANQNSGVQAEFFNALVKELIYCCETRFAAEMQLVYIRDELTPEAIELLKMFGED